jgi:hypothetical protein
MVRRRRGKRQKRTSETVSKTFRRKPSSKNLPRRSQSARDRALAALRSVRHGATLSHAAHDNGVTTRTMWRYVGRELVQDRQGGRIRATKSDRLVRYLVIPGPDGPREITVRGSKTATEFARYKAAVNRFLRGDHDALAAWHGKEIAGIELITAGRTLKSLAEKGLLPYSLYRSFSGGAL